jgi:hypothetical protein
MNQSIVDRFLELEQKLISDFPAVKRDAEILAEKIIDIRTANADVIWACAWNKPLFANTKVNIADKMIERLAPYMKSAWKFWGEENGTFYIAKTGKGIVTEAFEIITPLAQEVREKTKIATYRLFAIQGAARALRGRAQRSAAPFADLVDAEPGLLIQTVRNEMGPGWGFVTVLHFLTSFGLACKPDVHLTHTVSKLGISVGIRNEKSLTLAEAVMINRDVRCLVEKIYGSFRRDRLRYVDKILMEISRQKEI